MLGSLSGWDIRILASDIDTEMLSRAEAGIYSLESLADIPERMRRADFLRGYGDREGLVQVHPELRRIIEFRRINLNGDAWPPHRHFDVIFCRNVIIYFDRPVRSGSSSGLPNA